MGLNASSDNWNIGSDAIIRGVKGTQKIVDDTLIQAPTKELLFDRIRTVLDRCRNLGITISRKKLMIGNKVDFAGFVISTDGVTPDPKKLEAITNFPAPQDVSSLRSFLGLANQLGHFVPDLAHMTEPLRNLLKKDVAYTWLPDHEEAFNKIKTLLTTKPVVKFFDTSLRTEVLTDASRLKGIGYALIQRDPSDQIRLIQCGSRSLTPTESRYATIELECLGIQYALQHCRHYLLGLPRFKVVTDHRPLLGIFKKSLDNVDNARLRRLREKMAPYTFDLEWVQGKTHHIADALSRSPVFSAPEEEPDPDTANYCSAVTTDVKLQWLIDIAQADEDYQSIVDTLYAGKACRDLPPTHPARPLASCWHNLSLRDEGLIAYDSSRILVPVTARREILRILHEPHAGIGKTRANAKQLYFWPSMNNEIKTLVDSCQLCQKMRPTQPREPLQQTKSEAPMVDVSTDLFSTAGKDYLVMVDRYSGFPFVARLNSLVASAITKCLQTWFYDWGVPCTIRSDGGPQFRTSFNNFCSEWGIQHEPTSPYHPQSNGHAEAAVKQMKHLLIKSEGNMDLFKPALLEWRNTPRVDGFSPAQMFLGRRQRTTLPTLFDALRPIDQDLAKQSRDATMDKDKERFDHHSTPLPPLHDGQRVLIQSPITKRWDTMGTITSKRDTGRSYNIELDDGKHTIRNRRFLKPYLLQPLPNEDGDVSDSQETANCMPPPPRRSRRLAEKRSVSFTP